MLEYASRIPENARDGAPVLLLLHGRGSDERDLAALASHFPPETIVISPRAPFPGAPWGYGPGWAWYRYIADDRPEPESFRTAQKELLWFVDRLEETLSVKPGPVSVGGFSQGGTMSLGLALTAPGRIASVLNFSGFLASHPDVAATPETVKGTRFFWGHGTHDDSIPFSLAERGRAALAAAGAQLDAHDYDIGHWIAPEELADAVRWLSASGD
jgi:phospholipase/carboxylesterase